MTQNQANSQISTTACAAIVVSNAGGGAAPVPLTVDTDISIDRGDVTVDDGTVTI